MSLDSLAARFSVPAVARPWRPGVYPDATKAQAWRQGVGRMYAGLLMPAPSADKAYILMAADCVWFNILNRLQFQHQTVVGDDLTPEYQVQGRGCGWLSNRLKFWIKKVEQ